jgi:hypothetical protein
MICILIVNIANAQLSAMPKAEDYLKAAIGGSPYFTDPSQFVLYTVNVEEEMYQHIYGNRHSAYILSPDLVLKDVSQIVDPGPAYYQVKGQTLEPVTLPDGIHLRFKKAQKLAGMEYGFSESKRGRFASAATGHLRYYSGGDFLADSLHFQQTPDTGLFRCAESADGPLLPVLHDNQNMIDIGVDFNSWYQQLHSNFYAAQKAVMDAETVEAIDSIVW